MEMGMFIEKGRGAVRIQTRTLLLYKRIEHKSCI